MNITTHPSGDALIVKLHGRLDAIAAPLLNDSLSLDGVRDLTLDFADCAYVSSAGIRSVLKVHQAMLKAQGTFSITHLSLKVSEVF